MAVLRKCFSPWSEGNRKSRRLFQTAALVAIFFGRSTAGAAPASDEYRLKAVFLFNFAQFVEWPPSAFPEEQSSFIIGVLGDDPFGPVLDETVRGETVGTKPLVIQRYRRVQQVNACHILFISKSESGRLDSITEALRGRNILTVSDIEDAALRGVMIRFLTENRKIRLRINLSAAKLAGLTISSKLLRPADIVGTESH